MYSKFRQFMKEKNLSAYRVSKDTGVSQAVLSYWKNGRSKPGANNLVRLSSYSGITVEELIKED